MRIILGQGVYAERLAKYLFELLGERFQWSSDESPPHRVKSGVWRLDLAENFWLVHEGGSEYRFESRNEQGRAVVTALVEQIGKNELVTLAKLVD